MLKKSEKKQIDFLGKTNLFVGISSFLVVASLALVAIKGLNFGIDFAGGTEIQVLFKDQVDPAALRSSLNGMGFSQFQVQGFGSGNEFVIRLPIADGKTEKEINVNNNAMIQKATDGLATSFSASEVRRVDSVGPQVGSELKNNSVLAIFYSLLLILIYIGLRFDYEFAPGAVISLFHDTVITLGIFALFNKEVNVQILAAILTIIGYSLNDTIVNFDRIRENLAVYKNKNITEIINLSINETLSRTILTSLTTMFAVLALYLFAGGVIADFAFTMGIGIVVGTYSSIYIASPLVVILSKMKKA